MTFLAKMAIVLKEMVMASRFGRKDELDAFLIAFLVPSFVASFLGNAMNTAFIPVYVQCKEKEGKEAAQSLFVGMSFLNSAALIVIALVICLAATLFLPGIASGFSGSKRLLTFHLFLILIPFILLSGIAALWSAVLNAQEYFGVVVLSPVISPLLIIVLLFIFPSGGILVLAYGILLGILGEAIILGTVLHTRGERLWPRWKGWSVSIWEVIRQFIPAAAGSLLMGSTIVVDQSMAALLPAGSVAALSYGNKVIGFMLTLLTTTLVTLMTPYFSKKAVYAGRHELSGLLRQYLIIAFPLGFLLSLSISIFSGPLVRLIFYRGAFTLTDVQLVAGVQSWLAWQIPFYISAVILSRWIAAMRLNWIISCVAACNLIMNILLNYLLMKRMGVYGIALSTTLVHAFSFLLLLFFIYFSRKRAR